MAIKNFTLNDTQIKNLKPTDKIYQVSDGSTGLLLMVYPSGSKSWIFSYTHPVTKKRITKKSFGQYPAISLLEARKIRDEFKALLAKGLDPYEEKARLAEEQKSKIMTVEKMAREWAEWYAKKKNQQPQTSKKILRQLEIYLFPRFGNYELSKIRAKEVIDKFLEVEQDGFVETLRRVLGNFEKIMNYARNRDFISHNSIENIKDEFITKARVHQLTIMPHELPEFLADLQKCDHKYQTKLLVKFQLLTILRSSEACAVEWSEIDWENKLLSIPAEKMKGGKRGHIVPLSSQVLDILEEMKPFTGHRKFIFSSRVDKHIERHVNSETVNKAIKRMANEKYKNRLVAHGLRSIASTYLHDVFTKEYQVVESCLAHKNRDSTATSYDRGTYLNRRREIMQEWADFVEKCKKG